MQLPLSGGCLQNLVSFGLDITELHVYKNHEFVLPINILTVLCMPHFLGPHYHNQKSYKPVCFVFTYVYLFIYIKYCAKPLKQSICAQM